MIWTQSKKTRKICSHSFIAGTIFSDLMFFSCNGIMAFKCGCFAILSTLCSGNGVRGHGSFNCRRLPNLMWLNLASNCISSLPPEGELQGLQAHWGVALGCELGRRHNNVIANDRCIVHKRVVIWGREFEAGEIPRRCNIIESQRPMEHICQLAVGFSGWNLHPHNSRGCACTIALSTFAKSEKYVQYSYGVETDLIFVKTGHPPSLNTDLRPNKLWPGPS